MKFYKCPVCGNIITVIEGDIDRIKCCEAEMEELKANITEAVTEKHIPVYEIKEDEITVKIGEVEHPMTEEHYIMFIAQVANNQINIIKLEPTDKPEVNFPYIKGSKIYEYCNLHGLWIKEVE